MENWESEVEQNTPGEPSPGDAPEPGPNRGSRARNEASDGRDL